MRFLVLAILGVSSVAQADQVVVTEVTYTHSATTTTDSHYRLDPLPGTPTNWVSPVDYSHGTAVVRLEVFTKPTAEPTRFQICFEATPSYACTDQAPAYTTTGVYTWTTQFPNFYQYSQVDWTQGTRRIALILKDTRNVKPAPENVGATESAKFMPTDLRVTVTLVSPGGTYVPPPPTDAGVDAGVADAGAGDAGQPDAGSADAGARDGGVDAGSVDAGVGGEVDAGSDPQAVAGGCGCTSGSPSLLAALALVTFVRRKRCPASSRHTNPHV